MTVEAAPGTPARVALDRLAEGAGVLRGAIAAALADLRRRRLGVPAPRLGLAGWWEGWALAAFAAGLVAASMLLVDPLVLGLRLKMPAWLVVLCERLTDLGYSGVVLWPLGIALAYALVLTRVGDGMGRRVAASVAARVGFLVLAIAPVGLGISLLKYVVGRARPYAALRAGGADPELTFHVLAWKSSFASFPSGHATTTFAVAVAFAALFPRARGVLLALAVAVAMTRVVLGSHYPSDVIAGAAIGSAFALWMIKVFAARRRVFGVDGSGRIAPMAGPSARRLGCLLPMGLLRPAAPVEEARP